MNVATANALDAIAARAADVYRAYAPGAQPFYGDVAAAETALRPTLDPLAIGIPDGDYLVTSDDAGRRAYTRNGALHLSGGVLCTGANRPVLGFAENGAALTELHIDPVDAALGRAFNARIEADGTVAYDRSTIDPRTGVRENGRVVAGRIALARFPAATRMSQTGTGAMFAPPGIVPHVGTPGDGNFTSVAPMHNRTSGIDIERSLERLSDAYVAFSALQAAQKAQGSLGKTAMDLLK